jgi:replicative DNA helicase
MFLNFERNRRKMGFRHISAVSDETEKYIDDRRKGLIKSCKTGFEKLDMNLLGGIEWGSVVGVGGRPAVGKTLYSSCILRGIIKNNPLEDLEILDFHWEMSGQSLLIRDLSAELGNSYGEIISAENGMVSEEKMGQIRGILGTYRTLPWFLEDEPKSAKEFEDVVSRRVDANPNKKRVVRIDHSILAKRGASEASQVEMLQNLLQACVKMKKKSNIIFIILTQLLRDFETRQEDGTDAAYPRKSDCFGGDAVAQSCEIVLLLNRPAAYGVQYYGRNPDGRSVEQNDLFAHLVKSRNSASDLILSYEAQFEKMKLIET